MGNCTVTIKKRQGLLPTGRNAIVDIALSTSYATGGDTVPLSAFAVVAGGIRNINALMLSSSATTPGGHQVEVIHSATDGGAPLLRVRDVASGAEISNATNLSAQSVRALVVADLQAL